MVIMYRESSMMFSGSMPFHWPVSGSWRMVRTRTHTVKTSLRVVTMFEMPLRSEFCSIASPAVWS